MKKIIYILILVLFLSYSSVLASTNVFERTKDDLKIRETIKVTPNNINAILKTPKILEEEKVYDFANLFLELQEKTIYQDINKYVESTNYDLAVVTINYNNKYNEVAYADDFYDYNYFGYDDSFSGSLILIDMDNRKIYISTTGLAIKMYDNRRIDRIIDAGYTYLQNGNYAKCILSMINELMYYYNLGYPSSNDNLVIHDNQVYRELKEMTVYDRIKMSLSVSIVISLIISLIMYFKTRLTIKKVPVTNYLIDDKNVKFEHHFVDSHISRVLRSHDNDSGGSSSSGSSFHYSSSGSSHGGGGRSF